MKRKHRRMAIVAAAVVVCAAANAQESERQQQQQRNVWADSLAYDEYLGGEALRASELIGSAVQNEEGEDLGEVTDLIISQQDDVIEAVIALGGVLGIGEKQIAVPYERLRISADGDTLFLGMTREQLEAAPEYEEPERGDARVSRSTPAGIAAPSARAGQSAAQQQRAQPAQPQAQQRQQEQAQQRAQQQAEQQRAQQQAQQRAEQHRQQQAQQREQQVQQQAEQREQQQPAQQQAQQPQQQEAQQRQQQAQQRERPADQSAERQGQPVIVMERSDRRATELIGMTVVDSRGEQVGAIDDLVVSPEDGRVQAVVSIGGTLGLGERLVSVPLDELQMAPATQQAPGARQDEERESTVRLNMTSDELRTRPQFQYSDAERTANVR